MHQLFILLFILFTLAACTPPEDSFIIHNVNGYTFIDDILTEFEAISIREGKVEAIGTFDDMMKL